MQLNSRIWGAPGTNSPKYRQPHEAPQRSPFERSQPFTNPDVFRPAYPTGPDGSPDFPAPPRWIPPMPGKPEVDIPYEFPKEFPERGSDEWRSLPHIPREIPDWSDAPWQLPQPKAPEITVPAHFPAAVNSDGVWLLS